MDAFELADLLATQGASGRLYHEFIRTHDLSVGLYVLPAGATDPQGPHTEDEVYYVVSGRATIMVGDAGPDIGVARRAGIPVVGVSFGYTDIPIAELKPDWHIGHMRELPEAVEALIRPQKTTSTN